MTAAELICLVGGTARSVIAMYKLLGDESGLKNAAKEKVCMVSGLLGSSDQWDDFNAGWKQVLTRFAVPEFHGLDFWDWHFDESTHERIRTEFYQKWTEEDDFDFIDSLLRVIEKAKLIVSGTGIVIEYFFELTERERRWLTTSALYDKQWVQKGKPNDPWFVSFQSTIINAASHVPVGEKMYPIFEMRNSPLRHKKPEEDKAREVYKDILDSIPPVKVRDRLGESLVFGSRKEHIGLQAADLLANRSRIYVVEGLGDSKLGNRVREFLERGSGYTKMLNLRGLDLVLRGCPFRSTFWKTDRLKMAEPDYVESMRRSSGLNVVAYKGVSTGNYYSHHIKPEKLRRVKKLGVSGSLVYITTPDTEIQPNTNHPSGKEK